MLMGYNARIGALVLATFTILHPVIKIGISDWNIPKIIRQSIDLLIGADMYISPLLVGQIILQPNLPLCISSTLL